MSSVQQAALAVKVQSTTVGRAATPEQLEELVAVLVALVEGWTT